MKLVLVYQAGSANLFAVDSFDTLPSQACPVAERYRRAGRRVYQGDFRTAEAMARGAKLAGAELRVASCNMAGDVAGARWVAGLEDAPFRDKAQPPR